MSANRPVHEVRFGSVKAAIWANPIEGSVRHNVTLQRLYRDDGGWKTTSSFGRDDLPLVARVVDLAYEWIFQHGREASRQEQAAASDVPY